MKYRAGIAGFLVVIFAAILMFQNHNSPQQNIPQPTEYLKELNAKKEFRKHRQEWIESMHRAAPGVDWRKMDQETRDSKNREKLTRRAQLAAKGTLPRPGNVSESFAKETIRGVWSERGSNNQAGRIRVADFDPESGKIYASADGGNIWIGDLSGNNWTNINDFLKINGILMVRLLPNGAGGKRLIVAQRSPAAIYYTDDEGTTWNMAAGLNTIAGWGWLMQGIAVNNSNHTLYLLGVEWDYVNWHPVTTVYKSIDLGASFTQIASFEGYGDTRDLWTSRYGNPEVYLLEGNNLYQVDGSNNLNLISTFTVNISLNDVTAARLTGSPGGFALNLYALYAVSGQSHIYGSDDNGVNWNQRGIIPETPFAENSFSCSEQYSTWVYFGGVNAYRSSDGGFTWSKVNEWWQYYSDPEFKLHADIPGINLFRDLQGNEFTLVSTDGGIYSSDNQLSAVQNLSLSGLRISQYYSTYTYRPDPGYIYAGSQDQGFQRAQSDPGGIIDFEQTISGDYGHIVSGDGGYSIWTVYPGFAMYYPNAGGSTFNVTWDFVGSNYFWMPPLMADPIAPNKVYLGGGGSSGGAHLWHLTANASNVTAQEEPFDFSNGNPSNRLSAMAYSPLDPNYRYALTSEGQFYYSNNGGASWTLNAGFGGPPGHYFYGSSIVASPTVPGRVYIAGSGYSNPPVYVSNDHGVNFSPMSSGLPNTLVYEMAITPDGSALFAASEVGPYVYTDAAGSWEDIVGIYAPDQIYWSVDFVPALNTARFATYGRGIWDFQIESTAIDDGVKEPLIPTELTLNNYPNPFNPATTIEYSIPKAGQVQIDIYDVNGRRVRRLVNQRKAAGQYSVEWDGHNDAGRKVASGMYIYRLKSGDLQVTRRMTMVK